MRPGSTVGSGVSRRVRRRLPDVHPREQFTDRLVVTVPALHPETGDIVARLDGDEVTVSLGEHFHCHFETYIDETGSLAERERLAAERAVDFIVWTQAASGLTPDEGIGRGTVMERNRFLVSALALALVATSVHPSHLAAQADRDPLRSAMAKRIDEGKQGTGAVVGLLTPQGRSFATYGRINLGGPEVTPDTIFEIGSITKVFTAFLLADMVERGEVRLDDPVRKF